MCATLEYVTVKKVKRKDAFAFFRWNIQAWLSWLKGLGELCAID